MSATNRLCLTPCDPISVHLRKLDLPGCSWPSCIQIIQTYWSFVLSSCENYIYMNHEFRIKHVCYHIRRHPLLDHSLFRMHIISHNHKGFFGCAAISSCFLLSIWYCLSHNMCMGRFHAKVWTLLSTCRVQTETFFLATPTYKSNGLRIYKKKFKVVAPHFRIRKYPLTSPSQIAPNYLSSCTSCTSQYL